MDYSLILKIHHYLAFASLFFLAATTVLAFSGWLGKRNYASFDDLFATITLSLVHTQLLMGLVVYFSSPIVKAGLADMGSAMKDASMRYYVVEHITVMIIGAILVTIGRARSRRKFEATAKHQQIAIFFLIGLLAICSRVPWERLFA
jgi:sorbitol-specific phosphotransferase system component IIC